MPTYKQLSPKTDKTISVPKIVNGIYLKSRNSARKIKIEIEF